jgi:hypothetical protein
MQAGYSRYAATGALRAEVMSAVVATSGEDTPSSTESWDELGRHQTTTPGTTSDDITRVRNEER